MTRYLFRNVQLLDPARDHLLGGHEVLVEGEVIREVSERPLQAAGATVIDGGGRTLMPGLIDCHVHVCLSEVNIRNLEQIPLTLMTARAAALMRGMIDRGFTTVRDTGGADWGIKAAVDGGLLPGPRLFISGRAIGPTGGHSDSRRRTDGAAPCQCCNAMVFTLALADGPDEVRRAARENIRRDVDQIKIMASGGAMSPSDELDTTQFTVAEMRAAVEEAQAVGKYVLSHAYSDSAVRRAIEAGVRSIEHGNLIREAAARAIKDAGAFLVPTMVTYEAIYREGKRYGIGDHQVAKIDLARQQSVQGLEYAYRAGCKIGSGSDLLGDMMTQRAVEFELKGQVMTPMEVLLSATKVNAELFRMQDRIGSVEPGKYADLLVVQGNPLKNLRVFQAQDNIKAIMKGGRLYKRTA
jgi:imidazolonepropionase-like amidohydrolase